MDSELESIRDQLSAEISYGSRGYSNNKTTSKRFKFRPRKGGISPLDKRVVAQSSKLSSSMLQ